MNPPYRPYTQGNPTWVIFGHGTQFRMLLARGVDIFVEDLFMFRFLSFQSEEKLPTLWTCLYFNYE